MDPMNSDSPSGPPTDRAATRSRRLTSALTLSMLASWLLLLSPLPYALLSGLTGLVALVLLVLLIVRALRGRRLGMAAFGILLGLPALGLIIANAVLSGVFYGPMADLEQCRSTAITEQARIECEDAVQDSKVNWLSGVGGGCARASRGRGRGQASARPPPRPRRRSRRPAAPAAAPPPG